MRQVDLLLTFKDYNFNSYNGLLLNGTNTGQVSTPASQTSFVRMVGQKVYEMANHLGNVLVTVTDGRLVLNSGSNVTGYTAVVKSAMDYSVFGAPLVGRTFSSPSYKYGFNGMEKDAEMYGSDGSSYDFGARMYDARVGRWLSCDFFEPKYPQMSPYVFANNKPILLYDIDGNDVGYGPAMVLNQSSKPITLTGDGNIVRADGKEDIFRGAVVLNPGDSFTPMTETVNGVTTKYGIIRRKDGTRERTNIHDLDFIDVQPTQLMVYDDGVFSDEDIAVKDDPSKEYNKDEYVPKNDTQENRDKSKKEGENSGVEFINNPAKGEIDIDTNGGIITFKDEVLQGSQPEVKVKIIRIEITSGDLDSK
jgi:RHS repeat-associated protein